MSRMRTLLLAAAVVGVAACSDDAVQPDANSTPADFSLRGLRVSSGPEQVMPGEVIVKLKAGVDAATVGKAHGLALSGRGYKDAFVVLKGAVGAEHAAAAALRKDGRVVYAEPNYLRQPTAINPNLWAFYNPGGLNMKFTSGKSKGQPLPAGTYASHRGRRRGQHRGIRGRRRRRRDRQHRHRCGHGSPGVHWPADRGQGLVQQRQRPERRGGARHPHHAGRWLGPRSAWPGCRARVRT